MGSMYLSVTNRKIISMKKTDTDFEHHTKYHCGRSCSCTQDWGLDMFCRGGCGEGVPITAQCWTCSTEYNNTERFCAKMVNLDSNYPGRFYCHLCQKKQFQNGTWISLIYCQYNCNLKLSI